MACTNHFGGWVGWGFWLRGWSVFIQRRPNTREGYFREVGRGHLGQPRGQYKHMITVVYRTVSLEVEIMDFREEIEVKVSALLK